MPIIEKLLANDSTRVPELQVEDGDRASFLRQRIFESSKGLHVWRFEMYFISGRQGFHRVDTLDRLRGFRNVFDSQCAKCRRESWLGEFNHVTFGLRTKQLELIN